MNKYFMVCFETNNDYSNLYLRQLASKDENIFLIPNNKRKIKQKNKIIYKILLSDRLRDRYESYIYSKNKKIKFNKLIDKKTRKEILKHDNVCFYLSGCYKYIEAGIIDYLKKTFSNFKLFYAFGDTIFRYYTWYDGFNLDAFIKKFDFVCTYNPVDGEKYGIKTRPIYNKRIDYSFVQGDAETEEYDVYYIGKDKGRLEEILSFAKKCVGCGLKIKFHLVGIPKEKQQQLDGVSYGDYIPYEKMLSIEKKAKTILNIEQGGADGITLRDQEAIYMNKILITNGKAIFNSPFYTESKIIPIDDFENQIYKIKEKDDSVQWNGIDKYNDQFAYFNWIEKELDKKDEQTKEYKQ